jgi:hypothetical protein
VESRFDQNALLDRSHALARGPRVRLRLAQARDAPAIRALLQRPGSDSGTVDIAPLVRFDPRRRVVICATALIGSAETIVGVGAIDLDAAEPDVVVVDEALTDGLGELLKRALGARAAEFASRHAA